MAGILNEISWSTQQKPSIQTAYAGYWTRSLGLLELSQKSKTAYIFARHYTCVYAEKGVFLKQTELKPIMILSVKVEEPVKQRIHTGVNEC